MAPDYLTPGDIERLTASRVLLPETATGCTVPAEVAKATDGAMYNITAYGGETNLSYPARPEEPKVAWNIQWTTKVRYKSQTGGLLGQDMGGAGMFGMNGGSEPEEQAPPEATSGDGKKKKKKSGPEDKLHSRIKGDPKDPSARHRGMRPTSERPPAARVPPKRRER